MSRPVKKRSPVAAALVALRTRLGHTQESFSRVIGISLPTLGTWEAKSTLPTNIMLANLAQLAQKEGHEDLSAVFMADLEKLKERQRQKHNDIFDEINRWHAINGHLKALGNEADKLRNEKLKDAELPQRIVD